MIRLRIAKIWCQEGFGDNEDKCSDDTRNLRLTDAEVGIEIKKLLSGYEIAEVKSLPREQRDKILRIVKQIDGISLRQAARILGMPLTLVYMA